MRKFYCRKTFKNVLRWNVKKFLKYDDKYDDRYL